MQLKNYNVYFFLSILIGISVLTYFVISPFLVSFLIAAILAHLFSPAYDFFLKKIRNKTAGSLLTCFLVAVMVIVPVLFVLSLVVKETQLVLSNLSANPYEIKRGIYALSEDIKKMPFLENFDLARNVNQETITSLAKSLSQGILKTIQGAYSEVAHLLFATFIMFFSLFYLLIDGKKMLKKIMQLSPLRNKYEEVLIGKFNSITRATIKGTLIIAVIQGLLAGLLFFFSGVSSPVLLGILTVLASIIPSFGSGLIWFPVGIFMLILGNIFEGASILLFGLFVISTVDNFIRPKLIGSDTQMHPLMILFSTIGGIALFGISGFIVGPIIMSLFVAFWEIYALEFKDQLDEYN